MRQSFVKEATAASSENIKIDFLFGISGTFSFPLLTGEIEGGMKRQIDQYRLAIIPAWNFMSI